MKKLFVILFWAVFAMCPVAEAVPVSLGTAADVAAKFMRNNELILVKTYFIKDYIPAFYVFNTPNGFVIISADDCETPVLAYSNEGIFDNNNIPVQMEEYLLGFVENIQYGVENHIVADATVSKQWQLVKTTGRLDDKNGSEVVEPLLTTRWGQGCYYNDLCPEDENGPCSHVMTGCVATAMAQILHYWKYPECGYGSHTYNCPGYDAISADFNTCYQWNIMPDTLSAYSSDEEIAAVATLMFHCGVSVDMGYSANSSASTIGAANDAFKTYFKFSEDLYIESKGDDNAAWFNMLKLSLDHGCPVYYSGRGTSGHAFVCDGYDANGLLHFNWGWNGDHNGYYALGYLNPGNSYNNNNRAILGISPYESFYKVDAIASPSTAGNVDGGGMYWEGDTCSLRAAPNGMFDFLYWKDENGRVLSFEPSYSFPVNDFLSVNAVFSYRYVNNVNIGFVDINNPDSSDVVVDWGRRNGVVGGILKSFNLNNNNEYGVATDGNYIYTSLYQTNAYLFAKYSMDGVFVGGFKIDGCQYLYDMTYDGTYFYCVYGNKIYCMNLNNKHLVNIINTDCQNMISCSYDFVHDGFWVGGRTNSLVLVDRNGKRIKEIKQTVYNKASGFTVDADNIPHLYLVNMDNELYDCPNGVMQNTLASYEVCKGVYIGDYKGVEALYMVGRNSIDIYEFNPIKSQYTKYNVYRCDNSGDIIRLAEDYTSYSYNDTTWKSLPDGLYKYGVSMILENGSETDVIWSEVLNKGDVPVVIDKVTADLSLYPNPATDCLIVESEKTIVKYQIFNDQAGLVFENHTNSKIIKINVSTLQSGTYIIKLTTEDSVGTRKFIKR